MAFLPLRIVMKRFLLRRRRGNNWTALFTLVVGRPAYVVILLVTFGHPPIGITRNRGRRLRKWSTAFLPLLGVKA